MQTRSLYSLLRIAAVAGMLAYPLISSADVQPAASTGVTCNDGTASTRTGKGACSHHGGVKKSDGSATASSSTPATPASTTASSPPPAPTPAPAPAPSASTKAQTPTQAAAPGGGPGMVWVNSASKVYHCNGDRWYGKTKKGQYMTEADAKAQGNRPDHNKPCS
jgi:hypothetical protein